MQLVGYLGSRMIPCAVGFGQITAQFPLEIGSSWTTAVRPAVQTRQDLGNKIAMADVFLIGVHGFKLIN